MASSTALVAAYSTDRSELKTPEAVRLVPTHPMSETTIRLTAVRTRSAKMSTAPASWSGRGLPRPLEPCE